MPEVRLSRRDVGVVKTCLIEVAWGFLDRQLDPFLLANRDAVQHLHDTTLEAIRDEITSTGIGHLPLTATELDLIVKCIRLTMRALAEREFQTRTGIELDDAAETLAALERVQRFSTKE